MIEIKLIQYHVAKRLWGNLYPYYFEDCCNTVYIELDRRLKMLKCKGLDKETIRKRLYNTVFRTIQAFNIEHTYPIRPLASSTLVNKKEYNEYKKILRDMLVPIPEQDIDVGKIDKEVLINKWGKYLYNLVQEYNSWNLTNPKSRGVRKRIVEIEKEIKEYHERNN